MGRNADKRKERRRERDERSHEADAVLRATHAAREGASGTGGGPAPSGASALLWPATGDEAAHRINDLSGALFRLSAAMTQGAWRGEESQGLQSVARELAALLEVDTVSLVLLVEESLGDGGRRSSLRLVASQRRLMSDERLLTFHADDELAGEVLRSAQALRIDDAPRDPRFSRAWGQRSDIGSLLLVPLAHHGRLLGVLAVSRKEVCAFHDEDEQTLHIVARSIAEDLAQSAQLAAALQDPLTGMLGRQALIFALPREMERSRRYQTPLSLALLRVEGLSEAARRYGVHAIDAILRTLGHRAAPELRSADLWVRFGVDTFVLLAPLARDALARGAARVARVLLEHPIFLADVAIPLELSLATVELGPDDADGFALLGRAEQLLSSAPRRASPAPPPTEPPAQRTTEATGSPHSGPPDAP